MESREADAAGGLGVAFDVLRACAVHGLPPTALADPPGSPARLDADVIALACGHTLQGLMWAALRDGALEGDDPAAALAREAALAAMRTSVLSEHTAALTVAALSAAGICSRVLKGVALAHLDHDDPAERVFSDADVLIHRHDYERALTALRAAGFTRTKPPVRGWWERRFAKAVVLRSPTGGDLDLHLALASGYFGERLNHDRLWATPGVPFTIGGVTVRALEAEGRLLHACCHAVLGGGSGLRVRRDIAQLVLHTEADWQAVVAAAAADGAEHIVAEAVRTAWAELGLCTTHPFVVWATSLQPNTQQQRAVDSYRGATADGWAVEGRGLLAALGWTDRLRLLIGLAFPSRASLEFRGRTRTGQLASGARALHGRATKRQGSTTG